MQTKTLRSMLQPVRVQLSDVHIVAEARKELRRRRKVARQNVRRAR